MTLEPDRSHYRKAEFNKLYDIAADHKIEIILHIENKVLSMWAMDEKYNPVTTAEKVDDYEYIDTAAKRFHKRLIKEKKISVKPEE
jgi:hypothetical protein